MEQSPRFVAQGESNLVCKFQIFMALFSNLGLGLEDSVLSSKNLVCLVVNMIIPSSIGIGLRENASIWFFMLRALLSLEMVIMTLID